ncbi:hypothetical protein KAS79_00800 [Candidatus Parcubacteria bacterium]|nr:hypothetical protein [Candidatus Parcubacteria bacterium]
MTKERDKLIQEVLELEILRKQTKSQKVKDLSMRELFKEGDDGEEEIKRIAGMLSEKLAGLFREILEPPVTPEEENLKKIMFAAIMDIVEEVTSEKSLEEKKKNVKTIFEKYKIKELGIAESFQKFGETVLTMSLAASSAHIIDIFDL